MESALQVATAGGGSRQISSEELKEYLHLPAKEVAKELGMCLTSLKKVCRQHGIRRWPYRRLKSIDRRIQTLESTIAEGSSEQSDVMRQIDQLHQERATLPRNYGAGNVAGSTTTAGVEMSDLDNWLPSSPLSCASTTVIEAQAHEENRNLDESRTNSCSPAPRESVATTPRLSVQTSPKAQSPAPMTAAAALLSTLSPSTPAPTAAAKASLVAKSTPRPAKIARTEQVHRNVLHSSTSAAAGTGAVRSQGDAAGDSVKLEVQLPPNVAELVAKGAEIVVQHVDGVTQLRIYQQGTKSLLMTVNVAPSPAEQEIAGKSSYEEESGEVMGMSDDDMINALVGCAAEKASSQDGTDMYAEAAPAPEAVREGMSDEEIAAALANCVGSNFGDSADVAEETPPADEEEESIFCDENGWYDDDEGCAQSDHSEHHDAGTDMADCHDDLEGVLHDDLEMSLFGSLARAASQ